MLRSVSLFPSRENEQTCAVFSSFPEIIKFVGNQQQLQSGIKSFRKVKDRTSALQQEEIKGREKVGQEIVKKGVLVGGFKITHA